MQQSNFIDVPLARHVSGNARHTVHTDHAATSWIAAQQHNQNCVQNTTCCNTRSNAPDDGQKRPKHVELKEHQ
jgi:hypothetical protein